MRRCLVFMALLFGLAVPALAADIPSGGVVRVAVAANWPPMEFLGGGQRVTGYGVDYFGAVAQEAGLVPHYDPLPWSDLFFSLAQGRHDVVVSSISITPEREGSMDFTIPYAEIRQVVICDTGDAFTSARDLRGRIIGALGSSTGHFITRRFSGARAKGYSSLEEAMKELATLQIDAIICDSPVASYYIRGTGGAKSRFKVAFTLEDSPAEYYGFALQKGNIDLLTRLNKGILAVKEKGIEAELWRKWVHD